MAIAARPTVHSHAPAQALPWGMTRIVSVAPLALALTACALIFGAPEEADEALEAAQTVNLERAPSDAVLLAAGDIASCDERGDELTADLLERTPGTVAALGDLVYPTGALETYRKCYGPSWGRFLDRTRAAVGNHDYDGGNTNAYFEYFGRAAGPNRDGYYAYSLGAWRLIVLNSNCWAVGGCGPKSKQLEWLKGELEANRAKCTLAYWHHPRFSSALHGNNDEMQDAWAVLARAGVEVVLNGHDHAYERFVPLDAKGEPDPKGVRQFVVGTGGKNLYGFFTVKRGSAKRQNGTHGVLKLELRSGGYTWEFLPVAGGRFEDRGQGVCN